MKEFLDEYFGEVVGDFKDIIADYKESKALTPEALELLRLKEEQKLKSKKWRKNKEGDDLCLLNYLPFKSYDGQYGVFENENSFSFILRATHFSGTDFKTKMALKSLIENDIPENCVVQVINYASPRIGNIIDYWRDSGNTNDGLLGKIIEARSDFLKNGNWQSILPRRNMLLRDYELYFCFSIIKQQFTARKEIFYLLKDLQEKVIEGLKGSNCYAQILNNFELASFLQEILNPSLSLYKNYNNNTCSNFADYFSSSQTLEMKKDKIVFTEAKGQKEEKDKKEGKEKGKEKGKEEQAKKDEFNYVVLEVAGYPKNWSLEDGINYLGHFDEEFCFPCPFYISFGYSLNSREQSVRSADKQRLIMTKQGDSKLPRFFPAMEQEIKDRYYVSEKLSQGERMGKCIMYVVLMIGDKENADKYTQSVISHFSRLDFALMRIKHDVLNNFIHSLPFGMGEAWNNLDQQKLLSKTLSGACTNLMPVYGDQKNYAGPLMIFSGRKGELYLFDNYKIYDKNDNYNMIVVGKSGSGKSVFLEEYAINSLRLGAQVVIIDDGRSFENPCRAYGGDFVDFGGGNFCINPFSLYREQAGNETGDDYKEFFESPFIDLIVSILCILVNVDKNDNTSPENGLYRRVMKDAVELVMRKKGSNGGFADIRHELLNNEGIRTEETVTIANKMAYILRSYSEGREKKYFNGSANISVNNFFSVFEFSDLEHDQILQNSVLLVLVFLVYSKMRDREHRTALIIDEAWRLLKHPAMKDFIEGIARRARKYNGCLIVASQSISDFAGHNNQAAATVLSQSSWRIFLSVDDGDVGVLKNQVGMIDGQIHIAKGISGVKGSYSEFMIMHREGHWQIGRLLLDKFSAKLYSTTALDVFTIKKLQKEGMSVVEAIESLL
jgi:conjugal transfer ATP-binding protein TraC